MIKLRNAAYAAAILGGLAATMTAMPVGSRAEAAPICPQYLAQYCVVEKNGFRHAAWTNPCFAKQQGLRVLHLGMCEGPICSTLVAPVCSIDPKTGKHKTYSNQCWSDDANATLVHKGACKPPKK
ncbi:MAG: hypothetical protein WA776_21345 [Xanthobacteraceae bacterium]